MRTLCRVLVEMRHDGFLINHILCNTILVGTKGSNSRQRPRVDLLPSIAHNAHDDLLPSVLTPRPAPRAGTQMRDVLHNTMHRPTKQLVVFVIHRHHDEQLRPSWGLVQDLAEREPFIHKVVRIARGGAVPHVRELALGAERTALEELLGHGRVEDEVPVEQFDALHRLVSTWHALWDASVPDVSVVLVIPNSSIECRGDVAAWERSSP